MLIAFSGAIAVAVVMRTRFPIIQPSPRKSPGPTIARTASLPCGFTMVSLAFPDWMYRRSSQGSSCENITCPFLNLAIRGDPSIGEILLNAERFCFLGFLGHQCCPLTVVALETYRHRPKGL